MDSIARMRQLLAEGKDHFREIEDILDVEYPLSSRVETTDDVPERVAAPAA